MNHHLNCSVKDSSKVRGKRAAKTILFTMLALCMTFGLSSCGGAAKETKENQVKDDVSKILSQDAAFSDYNLEVTSFSVSKRQTNTENKTDFVWCDVTATGNSIKNTDDKFSCTIECEVAYGLYNDGWHLDTCTYDMVLSSIKPLSYPTKERVKGKTPYQYGAALYNGVDVHDMVQISDTEVAYQIDLYDYITAWTSDTTITKTYIFDLTYGWRSK